MPIRPFLTCPSKLTFSLSFGLKSETLAKLFGHQQPQHKCGQKVWPRPSCWLASSWLPMNILWAVKNGWRKYCEVSSLEIPDPPHMGAK